MTIEYNNINLFYKNKIFIVNTEAIKHNIRTLNNVGCNTKNISDSTNKVLTYQNGKKNKKII